MLACCESIIIIFFWWTHTSCLVHNDIISKCEMPRKKAFSAYEVNFNSKCFWHNLYAITEFYEIFGSEMGRAIQFQHPHNAYNKWCANISEGKQNINTSTVKPPDDGKFCCCFFLTENFYLRKSFFRSIGLFKIDECSHMGSFVW